MAFDSLSEKLQNVFKNLRSKGRLTEDDVKTALKEVKMLQAAALGLDVERAPDGGAKLLPRNRPGRRRGGLRRVPSGEGQAEETGQRIDRHGRGIGFALLGIARDVRRGEQCAGEQPAVDGGFVLPDVEYAGKAASQQGRAVHDLAARGVQDYGAGFHPCEKGVAGHAARRVVERRVERQDVGLVPFFPNQIGDFQPWPRQ